MQWVGTFGVTALPDGLLALTSMAFAHGVIDSDEDQHLKWVFDRLLQLQQDSKAQWVFSDTHNDIMVEKAIVSSGLYRFDRSFIDDNVRWIIDFKAVGIHTRSLSLPHHTKVYVANYGKQIHAYVKLFQQLEPNRTIRAGLYFPLQQAWIELPLEN